MKKFAGFLLTLTIACCAVAASRAEDKISAGHAFALKVCAACHVVAKDQRFAPILKPPAPSFADLARRSDLSETFLRQFLTAPHGKTSKSREMPNPQLADYQIDEVVAYFLSLKGGS